MALKRKSLSIEDKLNLLSEIDKAPQMKRSTLAKNLNLPLSTLLSIVSNRKAIEGYAKEMCGRLGFRRKRKSSPFGDVELVLMAWIKQCTASNLLLNGCLIKEKGLIIARKLGVTNFTASSGWLDRFKNRFGVVYPTKKRILSVSEEAFSSTEWINSHLLALIEDYDACDIYNADETGLFYNLLIDGSCHDVVEYQDCDDRGDRLTVFLCTNSDGSSKLPPLIIGKCDRPSGFQNFKSLPCKYAKNSKAWITTSIFEEYLHYIDDEMKTMNRKILLFVDHCAAHPPNIFLNNVKVVFFPSSCSNEVQPFCVGVMNAFKKNYWKTFEHNSELIKSRHGPSSLNVELIDALQFIILSWDEVSSKIIRYCFFRVGFPMVNVDESLLTSMETLKDVKTIDPNNRIPTCGIQTINELCEELRVNDIESDGDDRVKPDDDVSCEESQRTDSIKTEECAPVERNTSSSIATLYENYHKENGSAEQMSTQSNGKQMGDSDDDLGKDLPNFEEALNGFKMYKKYVSNFNIDEDMQNMLLLMEIALYKLHNREKLHSKTGDDADKAHKRFVE